METVSIPESYFVKNIKLQYSNPSEAMVREALQNSLDAGATEIRLTVSPEGRCSIEDNGCGMTAERMVEALLTLGGSLKASGAIGGFGEAKLLLLFGHRSYFIHSRDVVVHGKGLHYELTKGDERRGTLLSIEFHEEFGFNYAAFMAAATEVLKQSDLSSLVTLNGETVAGTPRGRTVRKLPWAKIHCRALGVGAETCYAQVRANGLAMFQHYLGYTNKCVVVEVTGAPKEVFTANRDRLSSRYADELQELFNELVVDKKSFGRKPNEQVLFAGGQGAIAELVPKELEAAGLNGEALQLLLGQVQETLAGQPKTLPQVVAAVSKLANPAHQELLGKHAAQLAVYLARHEYDFLVQVEPSQYRKIPRRLEPSNLSPKFRPLAQLWKHCLKHTLEANGLRMKFRIGWVLNREAEACYLREATSAGVPAFLLNPEHPSLGGFRTKPELFAHLLVVAGHEIAHLEHHYHNEEFSTRFGQLLSTSLGKCGSFLAHCQAAATEVL